MHQSTGLNVLVVGDRQGFAESLSPPLRADGHHVGDVQDAGQALAAARVAIPDVVVLDVDAAGLDAPAVAKGISGLSVRRRPFVIALSSHVVVECPPSAGTQIDLYLLKTSDLAPLRKLLRRFQAVAKDFESFDPVI